MHGCSEPSLDDRLPNKDEPRNLLEILMDYSKAPKLPNNPTEKTVS